MLKLLPAVALIAAAVATTPAFADKPPAKDAKPDAAAQQQPAPPPDKTTTGNVTIRGQHIKYKAVAGTIVLDAKDRDDQGGRGDDKDAPSAHMFYVAYFKDSKDDDKRPVTFIYNGGPGSSSLWLHMGALSPRRVETADDSHTHAAPYDLVNNDDSILDATDLVFIDAPGTGFSRIYGKDKEKAYYGVDQDAQAFGTFITKFLSKYGRWNSPKYLFGESYGTTRSALLANVLETEKNIDLNGVILLSQILNFDTSIDGPEGNPGIDLPYELALPTYAATAWYHHKLAQQSADLPSLLKEVEQFAMSDYAEALSEGAMIAPERKHAIAEKMHDYTGLPVAYLEKADLRVSGGMFEQTLLGASGDVTGRFDTRFSGPSMDPLAKETEYDPQSAAISSAYVSAFNDYLRKDLEYGQDMTYKPTIDIWRTWDFQHKPPGAPIALPQAANVLPDLAQAMIYNPNLKVMLNTGYYDLATPFYAAIYELHHLPMPAALQKNISYAFYQSGHMVYAHPESRHQLHDNVTAFIDSTSKQK
ncbi:S10 family peptidase [Solimonas marina]|uniref:Peptidase S10 n=1 Tax=Solimonas marina TaxID=2714601 RepID=A0A970B3A0_9GAMM|nr:peptidase S10 [Solimonas marina]NKF21022.1 peptidase S10 [Solimonas marina]